MRSAWILFVLALVTAACSGDGVNSDVGERSELDTTVSTEPNIELPTADEPVSTTSTASTTTEVPLAPTIHGIDAAPGVGDTYFPSLGNAGYDAVNYDLNLEVDTATDFVRGHLTLTAVAQADLKSFSLDLVGMRVVETKIDGDPVEHEHTGEELVLSAASTIATGSTFVVDVAYEGVPVLVDSPAWRTGVGWVDAGS
ncbi:MAG: M1 family metallopeptidase, partial [Actinomycetia bacterium]|nr:M1 family metallopeptidase [Actinomycetes bacterium]